MVLLNFQRWLKQNTDLNFVTIVRRRGSLEPEFARLGETIVIERSAWEKHVTGRVAKRLGWPRPGSVRRLEALRDRPYRLIYSNTVTNGAVIEAVARPGVPIITHVHELNHWIHKSGPENWNQVCRHTTKFVAVSEAVSRNLQESHQVLTDRIEVVHEFIPVDDKVAPDVSGKMRTQLGIPSDAFVVGGSGAETWRKGKDLFVQLAISVHRHRPHRPFWFVWVGWEGDEEDQRKLKQEIKDAGIVDNFVWTGEVDDPLEHFACFDAFALVSRDDPFPLVCLEAALLQKPVLCFDGAGGAPELVETDAGFVAPYLDVTAMAEKLILLGENEELRRKMGARGAAKVRDRFSLGVQAPRLYQVVENLLNIPAAAPIAAATA